MLKPRKLEIPPGTIGGSSSAHVQISLPRYTFWLVIFRLLVPVVTTVIWLRTGISVGLFGWLTSLLPVVLAASIVGRKYARQSSQNLETKDARRFAVSASLRFLVVELIYVFGVPSVLGRTLLFQSYLDFITGEYALFIWSLMGIGVLVAYGLNLFFVGFSAKLTSARRAKARKRGAA